MFNRREYPAHNSDGSYFSNFYNINSFENPAGRITNRIGYITIPQNITNTHYTHAQQVQISTDHRFKLLEAHIQALNDAYSKLVTFCNKTLAELKYTKACVDRQNDTIASLEHFIKQELLANCTSAHNHDIIEHILSAGVKHTVTPPVPAHKPETQPVPAPAHKPETQPVPAPAHKPETQPVPAPAHKSVTPQAQNRSNRDPVVDILEHIRSAGVGASPTPAHKPETPQAQNHSKHDPVVQLLDRMLAFFDKSSPAPVSPPAPVSQPAPVSPPAPVSQPAPVSPPAPVSQPASVSQPAPAVNITFTTEAPVDIEDTKSSELECDQCDKRDQCDAQDSSDENPFDAVSIEDCPNEEKPVHKNPNAVMLYENV